MLDERQSFKAAFLARCIEQGHTSEEDILSRVKTANAGLEFIIKQANPAAAAGGAGASFLTKALGGLGGSIGTGIGNTAGRIADLGTAGVLGAGALALAAPPLIGYGLGSAAGNLKNLNDVDIDEIKRQELIDELRRQTDRLQQHNQARQSQSKQDKRRPGRAFM